jgi:hypothetical protein
MRQFVPAHAPAWLRAATIATSPTPPGACLKTLIAAALLATSAVASTGAAATNAPPYQLDATEVRDLPAPALQRDYQLFIALPDSYGTGARRYPVLFVTDANYAFPIVRGIAQRLHKHARMEEAIVVGLSYAKGDTGVYSRRRRCRAITRIAPTCPAACRPSAKRQHTGVF